MQLDSHMVKIYQIIKLFLKLKVDRLNSLYQWCKRKHTKSVIQVCLLKPEMENPVSNQVNCKTKSVLVFFTDEEI